VVGAASKLGGPVERFHGLGEVSNLKNQARDFADESCVHHMNLGEGTNHTSDRPQVGHTKQGGAPNMSTYKYYNGATRTPVYILHELVAWTSKDYICYEQFGSAQHS
jgi:hypothetical protein